MEADGRRDFCPLGPTGKEETPLLNLCIQTFEKINHANATSNKKLTKTVQFNQESYESLLVSGKYC